MVVDVCLKAWSTTQKSRGFEQRRGRVLRGHQGSKRGPWYRRGFAREQALGRSDTSMLPCGGFRTWCEKAKPRCPKSQVSMSKAEGVTSLMPLKWELPGQSWRLCNRIETHRKAGRERPRPPAMTLAVGARFKRAAFRGCGRKHRETPSSAQSTTLGTTSRHFSK